MTMPLIKRYSNRKLYDTQAKRYVTLEGVADLIRQGEEVKVTDHETGEDITALVQAQTIFELEKKLKGGLPGVVLTNLIRAGSGTLNQLRVVLTPVASRARVDADIERRIQVLVDQHQLSAEEGARLLDLLRSVGDSTEASPSLSQAEIERVLHEYGIPSRQEWETLMRRLDALNAEMEHMEPPSPRTRSPRAARKNSSRKRGA